MVNPFAISEGKIFLRLFLNSCVALFQLPANAPPKKSKSASNAFNPMSTVVTIPSNTVTAPAKTVSKPLFISFAASEIPAPN